MKKFLKSGAMFDILKKVRSVATPENYNAVVDTCSWVAAAVRPSSGPEKVGFDVGFIGIY